MCFFLTARFGGGEVQLDLGDVSGNALKCIHVEARLM